MRKIIFFIILFLNMSSFAWSAFSISTDHRAVDFGQMALDEKKELTYLGDYHNEITCTSSNDKTWYLKVNLLSPLSSGANKIPLDNFKWQLVWTDGRGTTTNPHSFKTFGLTPGLTYISGPNDSAGTAVHLRFKYSLEIPEMQAQGIYTTVVRFTLTEML